MRAKAGKKKTVRKKIMTVSDILAKDDIKSILGVLEEHKAELKGLVCVVFDDNGFIRYLSSVSPAETVYLLEQAKLMVLGDDGD
jgi:hypothetical protein